jgi:hypothetical protein
MVTLSLASASMAAKTTVPTTSASRRDGSPENYNTLDGLLKSHASELRDIPLLGYPATGVTDFEEHTAKDLDAFADAAVAKYVSLGLEAVVRNIS